MPEPPKQIAPEGKYRIIGVFVTSWIECDVDTFQEAVDYITKAMKDTKTLKMHVYNDKGKSVYAGGRL